MAVIVSLSYKGKPNRTPPKRGTLEKLKDIMHKVGEQHTQVRQYSLSLNPNSDGWGHI
jgi:hypothetical protein